MSPSSRHRPTVLLITTIICSACSAPVVTCATPPNKLGLRSQWDRVFAYLSRLFYPRYSPLAMVFVASTVANVKEDKTGFPLLPPSSLSSSRLLHAFRTTTTFFSLTSRPFPGQHTRPYQCITKLFWRYRCGISCRRIADRWRDGDRGVKKDVRSRYPVLMLSMHYYNQAIPLLRLSMPNEHRRVFRSLQTPSKLPPSCSRYSSYT
ncbi:hypothetical protein F5880DRAFT_1208414 [Lentinula raphanica]|nr:hypothetical protein F5880DRAFT_1208414 [Lentinula raphanica]